MNKKIVWGVVILVIIFLGYQFVYKPTKIVWDIPPEPTISEWKTYTNTAYGFQIQYPTGTEISDIDVTNGRSVVLQLPDKSKIVDIYILNRTDCNDTSAGVNMEKTQINNVDFVRFDLSKIVSGKNSSATATEYCVVRGSREYKIVPRLIYGTGNPVDVNKDGDLNRIVNSFKFIPTPSTSPSSIENYPAPVITSLEPRSGPIGTVITIKGQNLSGFEGDLDAWIENSKEEVGFLPGGSLPRQDQTIRVKIDQTLCTHNNNYTGECMKPMLTITPGIYKIYTKPWTKKSNTIEFTVTPTIPAQNITPTVKVVYPNGGETFKIGSTIKVTWNTTGTIPSGAKFELSVYGNGQVVDASPNASSHSLDFIVPKYWYSGDTYDDMAPGQYKIRISLYDGNVPKDVNGKTCMETPHIFCAYPDRFGKIIAEDQSDATFTITN